MATAAQAARGTEQEDVIEGNLVVRHSLTVRVAHWWTAVFFVLAFLSGAALFSPRFYFLTNLFGSGYATRQLHPWFSLFFIIGLIPLFLNWAKEMAWSDSDTRWLKNFKRYMRHEDTPDVGKFNAGQKLFFWAAGLGGIALLLTGVVMWFPESFPVWVRYLSYPLHELVFILFGVAIVYHLYITLFALGGTLRAMTRGTVSKNWASSHHPRWYEEVNRK